MLGKLMKYDFISLFKMLLPIYGIILCLSFLVRIFGLIGNTVMAFKFVFGLLSVVFVIAIILLPFIIYIVSIIKFYQSMTRDEGYLTHTLPVTKTKLVLSKFLVSIITMVSGLLVMIVCLFIAYSNINLINAIMELVKGLFDGCDLMIAVMIVLAIVLGYLLQLAITYLAISMGGMHQQKILFTFIYGFGIYTAIQIIMTIVLVIAMIIDPSLYNSLESDVASLNDMNLFLGISNVLSLIFTVICLIISVVVLDKKLNLE